MISPNSFVKENLKALGILVRYKRVSLGFSLRDLAKKTKISHTLISNFERGIVIPNEETIREIFNVLDLEFYNDKEISKQFEILYKQTFSSVLNCDYLKAEKFILLLEKQCHIYENSVEVINYAIIRCLYYVLSDSHLEETNRLIKRYETVLDFFTPKQKQLFHFIRGVDLINKKLYKDAREYFEEALTIGDKKIDVLINEYYVIALSKANKYVDAIVIAEKAIVEYEEQTIYIRAMRLRTQIAYNYFRFTKVDKALKLYQYVIDFAEKFQATELLDYCNEALAYSNYSLNEIELAKKYISKVSEKCNAMNFIALKLNIAMIENDEEAFEQIYSEYYKNPSIKHRDRNDYYIEIKKMTFDKKYFDRDKYVEYLEKLRVIGYQSDDGELIEGSSSLLAEQFQKERQYKKAYEVNRDFLHYLKYGV